MSRTSHSLGLLLLMIVILTILSIGCSAKLPEARLMPLAKVQVPPAPKLEPVLGLIPLKNGQQVLHANGKKYFIVPKTGGVFFPKLSAENVSHNDDLWHYYSAGIEDSIRFYNSKIDTHNDKLADIKMNSKKPWYKRLW